VPFEDERALAEELAEMAAGMSLAAFGGRHDVEHKADGTPVTRVDVAIEDVLRAVIAARFPGDAILGEERGESGVTAAARRWTVDPIDGTKHFADGVPLWSTLVGLQVDDSPVLGLVDAPAVGDRWIGVVGEPATHGGSAVRVSDVARLADAAVGHSGVEEWATGTDRDRLLRLVDAARRSRGLSDAWGQMQVAAGAVEACVEHDPCGVWDWTPVVAIVAAAGGRVSTLDGTTVHAGCDLLVTNGLVHDEAVEVLAGRRSTTG